MKRIILFGLSCYQALLSPDTGLLRWAGLSRGGVCPFYPSCSEYAKQSVARYGAVRGGIKAARRVLRCYPGRTPAVDTP